MLMHHELSSNEKYNSSDSRSTVLAVGSCIKRSYLYVYVYRFAHPTSFSSHEREGIVSELSLTTQHLTPSTGKGNLSNDSYSPLSDVILGLIHNDRLVFL